MAKIQDHFNILITEKDRTDQIRINNCIILTQKYSLKKLVALLLDLKEALLLNQNVWNK